MQTIDVKVNAISESMMTIIGSVELTDDDLYRIVRRSGQAIMFEDRIREAITMHVYEEGIKDLSIPRSHDLMACVVTLKCDTGVKVWDFSCIGVSRF